MNSGYQLLSELKVKQENDIEKLQELLTELNQTYYKADDIPSDKNHRINDHEIVIWSDDNKPPLIKEINNTGKDIPLYIVIKGRFIWANGMHLRVGLMTKDMLMSHAELTSEQINWMFVKTDAKIIYCHNDKEHLITHPIYRSRSSAKVGVSFLTESMYEFYDKQKRLRLMPSQ